MDENERHALNLQAFEKVKEVISSLDKGYEPTWEEFIQVAESDDPQQVSTHKIQSLEKSAIYATKLEADGLSAESAKKVMDIVYALGVFVHGDNVSDYKPNYRSRSFTFVVSGDSVERIDAHLAAIEKSGSRSF